MAFKKIINLLSLALLIIGPYLLICQGIDFTDKGLMLSMSTQVLKYPDAYTKYVHVWLSGIIGYGWLKVFPVRGLLGLNILSVLLLQLNALVLFFGLKKYFDKTVLLAAICIATLISIPLFPSGFGYQLVTVLFLSAGAMLLLNGVAGNSNQAILFSAVVFGISFFLRFTNILTLIFFITLFLYYGRNISDGIKKTIIYFVGFLIGLSAGFVFIFSTGAWTSFEYGILHLGTDIAMEGNVHQPLALLSLYTRDLIYSLVFTLKYFLLFALIGYTKTFIKLGLNKADKIMYWEVIIAGVVGLVVFMLYDLDYILKVFFKYMMPGVLFLFVVMAILFNRFGKERWLMLIIAALVYIIGFAGSSTGMNPYGILLLLCIAIAQVLTLLTSLHGKISIGDRIIRQAGMPLLGVLIVLAFTNNYGFVYRDAGKRSTLKYEVNSPALKGIYTTEARANCINELLEGLSSKVKPGDTIWAAPHIPMLYALTGCVPYAKQVWENGDEVEGESGKRRAKSVKIIVRAKGSTRNTSWPVNIIPNTDYNSKKIERIMNEFIARNNYYKTWENTFFEIWTR